MGSIRKKIGIAVSAAGLLLVGAIFISVVNANSTEKVEIRLAHNQSAGSEIAASIAKFSEFVAEDESKNLQVDIYASGVLGTEKEEIEMVQAGILDMAKVSSNTLGQFQDKYAIFAVPYLFVDQDHYYTAMEESEKVKELFQSTADDGYIAIGYYANGSRNYFVPQRICYNRRRNHGYHECSRPDFPGYADPDGILLHGPSDLRSPDGDLFRTATGAFCKRICRREEGGKINAVRSSNCSGYYILFPAGYECSHHGTAFCQEFFGMSNALCGNIAVDSGSGGIFENLAQVGTAEIKMLRKVFDRQVLCQVLINVGQDFIDLCMVGWRFGSRNGLFGTLSDKNAVQKCHHFQKYRMIQNILSVFFIIAKLVDIIMKAFLFFF